MGGVLIITAGSRPLPRQPKVTGITKGRPRTRVPEPRRGSRSARRLCAVRGASNKAPIHMTVASLRATSLACSRLWAPEGGIRHVSRPLRGMTVIASPRARPASFGPVGANDHSEEGGDRRVVDPLMGSSVRQVPESLSPRYRSRIRGVSGRYRSHGLHYEPGPHSTAAPEPDP